MAPFFQAHEAVLSLSLSLSIHLPICLSRIFLLFFLWSFLCFFIFLFLSICIELIFGVPPILNACDSVSLNPSQIVSVGIPHLHFVMSRIINMMTGSLIMMSTVLIPTHSPIPQLNESVKENQIERERKGGRERGEKRSKENDKRGRGRKKQLRRRRRGKEKESLYLEVKISVFFFRNLQK